MLNLRPHSASSLVVVVVITLLPSAATQLWSFSGQSPAETRNYIYHEHIGMVTQPCCVCQCHNSPSYLDSSLMPPLADCCAPCRHFPDIEFGVVVVVVVIVVVVLVVVVVVAKITSLIYNLFKKHICDLC